MDTLTMGNETITIKDTKMPEGVAGNARQKTDTSPIPLMYGI